MAADGSFPRIGRSAGIAVRGAIDSPTDGSTVAVDRLTISGWSLAGSSPSRGVVVLVDGDVVGGAPMGGPRPDVAAELGIPEADKAGFSCAVDLDAAALNPPSGSVTIDVAALLDDGTLSPVFARSTVLVNEAAAEPCSAPMVLEGAIDVPTPGTRVPAGVVAVEGWAAYGRRPVPEVFVQAGNQGVLRASGQTRTDVAKHFGEPAMNDCGFRTEVDLRHLIGRSEERVLIDVAVIVDDAQPGDSPGPVVTPLGSVEVVVDGSLARPVSRELPSDGHASLMRQSPTPNWAYRFRRV